MPAADPGQTRKRQLRKQPRTKHTGDAASGGGYDLGAAAKERSTPRFKAAAKKAYKSRPAAQRQRRVARIEAKPAAQRTSQDRAVLQTHHKRSKRDHALLYTHTDAYNDRQREIVDAFKRTKGYTSAFHAASEKRHPGVDPILFETDKAKLRAAGFKPDKADAVFAAPLGALASGAAVAEATYHDPIGVPVKTAKQALDAIPALPGQAYELATHPKKTIEAQAKAFAGRSGEKYDAKVKTIRKKGGLDYASDAAIVLAPASATARGLLRRERAAVRVTGGAAPKPRESRGLATGAVGSALDKRRAAKHERRLTAAEAGGKPVDALERQAAEANRKAGHVVEVVGRGAVRRQARGVAKAKSRGHYGFKHDQGTRLGAMTKTINKLNKHEKRAFYYAALGIRTPEHAAELLPTIRKKIIETRKREGIQVTGSLKKSDMLPDIDAILKDPAAHFTPKLAEVMDALTPESRRAGHEDPAFDAGIERARRHAPLEDILGLERGVKPHVDSHGVPALRYFDEADADFTNRIAATAKHKGLAEPLYFKSERYVGPRDFAAHALGLKRGMKTDQQYKGVNLRQGLQDTRPEQFLRGNARSIKRFHNWNLVANVAEQNVIHDLSRGGSTVSAIRERAAAQGVDQNSFALWNPGVMRRFAEHRGDLAIDERHVRPDEFDQAAVHTGLQHSTIRIHDGVAVDGTGARVDAGELSKSSGWVAVPDGVLKELEAQTVPSGVGGRAWDIAKGKASRAILLAGNVPWLGFQVASNVALGAAATGGRLLNPANWLQAHRWWKDMTPEEQQRVGGVLGLDATSADSHQVRLGATTNNDFVNAYRALKAHPVFHTGIARGRGPSVSQLNPLELMARADRGQNNIFRIVAGYSHAKRDAVHRMGENMGLADKAQTKMTSILAMPPKEQLRALREDHDLLERHGEAIADWMGDYTTMTARERKVINRSVMFYPYIRYSLKLLFYTLPVKHPAVTAVLAEMGSLHADELRKLLGDDNLPFNIGKIYIGKDGKTSIDLRRANPALNSVIDAARNRSLSQAVGIAPPFLGILYNQIAQESYFTGKDWRFQGHAAQYAQNVPVGAIDPRARILANDVLSLAYPYRLAQNMEINPLKGGRDERLAGPQGSDSLPFAPRPTHFKGKTALSKLQKKFGNRRQHFEDANDSLIHELIPLLPAADRSQAESRENAIVAKASQPAKKHKAKGYKFGGGSKRKASGYRFGG